MRYVNHRIIIFVVVVHFHSITHRPLRLMLILPSIHISHANSPNKNREMITVLKVSCVINTVAIGKKNQRTDTLNHEYYALNEFFCSFHCQNKQHKLIGDNLAVLKSRQQLVDLIRKEKSHTNSCCRFAFYERCFFRCFSVLPMNYIINIIEMIPSTKVGY